VIFAYISFFKHIIRFVLNRRDTAKYTSCFVLNYPSCNRKCSLYINTFFKLSQSDTFVKYTIDVACKSEPDPVTLWDILHQSIA